MICDTNLLKNPLSHHDTPVFSVNFTFKLIIAGSDTINCQIFQSWFYLKVELGKRINLVSDWEEGLTQSKWQSQWVMVQPSGRIGLTSVRRRLHLMPQRTTLFRMMPQHWNRKYKDNKAIGMVQVFFKQSVLKTKKRRKSEIIWSTTTYPQIRVWCWWPRCFRSCLLGSSSPSPGGGQPRARCCHECPQPTSLSMHKTPAILWCDSYRHLHFDRLMKGCIKLKTEWDDLIVMRWQM